MVSNCMPYIYRAMCMIIMGSFLFQVYKYEIN